METSIKKVKINEKVVVLTYDTNEIVNDELVTMNYQLKSTIKPHPDFFTALQSLKRHFINLLEFDIFKDNKKTSERHTIHTLSIYEDMDDTRIIMSGNKYIKSGKCFNVNSPLISLDNEDYEGLTELNADVEIIISEAKEYINGKNGEVQYKIEFEKKEND